MVYRGYTDGDSDAMFALDELCFEPPFRFTARQMRGFARAPNARVIVAEAEGVIAGFVILHVQWLENERVGYVVTLDVAEVWRRKGVASELMQHAEATATELACTGVLLHVYEHNLAAICFYERLGFCFLRSHESFYGKSRDGHSLHARVYRKGLPRAI